MLRDNDKEQSYILDIPYKNTDLWASLAPR